MLESLISINKQFPTQVFPVNIEKFLKPLIHDQINLIKFIESNKFDNVYSKV